MTFGEKLQALRKARGWSQEELAQQINVSRQALSKWESGTSVPDTENVVALSRLFGVPTDYLLLDEMEEPGRTCGDTLHLGRDDRLHVLQLQLRRIELYGKRHRSAHRLLRPDDTALHAAVGTEHGISGAAGGRRSGRGLLPSPPAPVEKALCQRYP